MPVRTIRSPEALTGLPKEFWWLWFGTLVNRIGTFVVPFLALYVTNGRGFDESTAALVLLVWGISLLPAPAIGGTLTDRIGRKPTMAIAVVGGSTAILALGLAQSRSALLVSAAATGLFAEMYRPAMSALMADIVPSADRPKAFGLQFWAVNLGLAVSASVGGLLAEVDRFLLLAGDAVTMLIFGVIVLLRVPEPPRPPRRAGERGSKGSFRHVLGDRLFLSILGLTTLAALVYSQVQSTLSVYVVATGLTPSQFGTLIALNGVIIVIVQPLALGVIRRMRPAVAMAIGDAVLAVGVGLTMLASSWLGFAATVFIWTLGEIVTSVFRVPIVADISPDDMRGRYQGWFGFSFAVAFAIGPSVGLLSLEAIGSLVWPLTMVLGLAAALGWYSISSNVAARRAGVL
jgi:predicted MFS family arabinose efflux permease